MNLKKLRNGGFTMIEIVVVITVLSTLAAVGFISYQEASAGARDDLRASQLQDMRLALELYKEDNGQYPEMGCGNEVADGAVPSYPGVQWAGSGPHPANWAPAMGCDEYIVGLTPTYISELPRDPVAEDRDNLGYLYLTNQSRTAYKLLVNGTVEVNQVQSYDEPLARCPYDCGVALSCGSSAPHNPQQTTYAIYSAGAECW